MAISSDAAKTAVGRSAAVREQLTARRIRALDGEVRIHLPFLPDRQACRPHGRRKTFLSQFGKLEVAVQPRVPGDVRNPGMAKPDQVPGSELG